MFKFYFWGPNTFSAGVWMSRLRWVAVVWNISIRVIFHPHDVLLNCFESSRCFSFPCFSPLSKNQRGPLPAIRLDVITPFKTIGSGPILPKKLDVWNVYVLHETHKQKQPKIGKYTLLRTNIRRIPFFMSQLWVDNIFLSNQGGRCRGPPWSTISTNRYMGKSGP